MRASSEANCCGSGTTRPPPTCSRWLSMIRSASWASSSRTETRVSPSGFTANGNTPDGGLDVRTDSTPWLSSSAWTTLASMSDSVLKMTISWLAIGSGLGPDPQQDHGHIIMLIGTAGKGAQLSQDVGPQLIERQVGVLLDDVRQPLLAEAVEALVHRLADAIREEHQQVALGERHGGLLQHRLEHLPLVDLEADDEAVGGQHSRLAQAHGFGPRHIDERAMAGAGEGHFAPLQVDDPVGHRDEALRIQVRRDHAVDL